MSVKMDASRQITEGVIWKQLLIFFFPIMLGSFFQQLYNTVDTVVVGQFVGKAALAAVGGSSAQIASLIVGFLQGCLQEPLSLLPTSLGRETEDLPARQYIMPMFWLWQGELC